MKFAKILWVNTFIAVFIHLFNLGWANSLDEDLQRLKAFREHQRFNAQFAQQRLAGRVAHDEMNEQWERQMEMARQDYIRQKKKAEMTEDGPEARADKVEKLAQQRAYEKIELEYLRQKRLTSQKNRRLVGLTEDEELGLLVNRPRFDRRRRVLYGATPRWKGQAGSGGGSRTSWSPS
ncbi:MAG: hypothetical protein N2578_09845, partial [Bdellovibrionaceae bacterium]|nr:hypothetical protein [Pseudobdellovibrionaceae bacterium]